ncbi:MAG: methyltransferase [Acholeplasma sp.]|nr:methyltransferase [Acholeplasma sp.]
MSGQYFDNNPSLKHEVKSYQYEFNGNNYRFLTDSGIFSRNYLDFGSETLIKSFTYENGRFKALDLGCGYGPIGILMSKRFPKMDLTMTDVNERAVSYALKNAKENGVQASIYTSDGFDKIETSFDVIWLNPPIRAGKEVIYRLYSDAFSHLNHLGEFWIVIQKKQGAESSINQLNKLFGNCEVMNKNKGYFVIKSKKL